MAYEERSKTLLKRPVVKPIGAKTAKITLLQCTIGSTEDLNKGNLQFSSGCFERRR